MPELPEVEILKRDLQKVLPGKVIDKVKIIDFAKKIEPKNLTTKLKGKKIKKVWRRQKMIIFDLDDNKYLVTHLKMTGQYVFAPKSGQLIFGGHGVPGIEKVPNKFTHAVFYLKNDGILYYSDLRKFGWIRLMNKKNLEKVFEKFGIEPLTSDFTFKYFNSLLEKYPKKHVKLVLLDQSKIAGLGNIYAAEILFASKVRPNRPAGKLTEKERKAIFNNIKRILSDSIKHRSTAENTYPNSKKVGGFTKKLKVYRREGEKCMRCKVELKRMKNGGRSTVYCPICQK